VTQQSLLTQFDPLFRKPYTNSFAMSGLTANNYVLCELLVPDLQSTDPWWMRTNKLRAALRFEKYDIVVMDVWRPGKYFMAVQLGTFLQSMGRTRLPFGVDKWTKDELEKLIAEEHFIKVEGVNKYWLNK
jgi:hypothetical protein